jgi:peptide chain release factor 2
MGEPGFWDDPEGAAKVTAEHARTKRRLDAFRSLETDAKELEGLVELAEEEPSLAAEVDESIASVE